MHIYISIRISRFLWKISNATNGLLFRLITKIYKPSCIITDMRYVQSRLRYDFVILPRFPNLP